MDKFCKTWECSGEKVDKKQLESFYKKVKLGFLIKKAMSLSNSRPLFGFKDLANGYFTLSVKSGGTGLTISSSLGPFKINGGAEDLVWKRPDGKRFYVMFTLSDDGRTLTQTNKHVDGKVPPIKITRTLDGDTKLVMTQECDGVVVSRNFGLSKYSLE